MNPNQPETMDAPALAYSTLADIVIEYRLGRKRTTFRKGQRVETFIEGPGVIERKQGNDYWILLDDNTRSLHGGGGLTRIK